MFIRGVWPTNEITYWGLIIIYMQAFNEQKTAQQEFKREPPIVLLCYAALLNLFPKMLKLGNKLSIVLLN